MFMGPMPWLNEGLRGFVVYGYDNEARFSVWDEYYSYGMITMSTYGHLLLGNESFSIY